MPELKELLPKIAIFVAVICILALPRLLLDIIRGRRTFKGILKECGDSLRAALRLKKKDDSGK